jgi:hypothetical protein
MLGFARKTFPRKSIHTEISPLRCASVEMTKGRAVLSWMAVADESRFPPKGIRWREL